MILVACMAIALAISVGALAMTLANLRRYRRPPAPVSSSRFVSVCVPARDEEANIEHCVRSLLASTHADLEVLVYDDQSVDATPAILARLAEEDPRVRPLHAQALPDGWNGKQHACWRCAGEARGDFLLFTDADVRFEPHALGAALAAWDAGDDRDAPLGLLSTFPRQIVRSPGEALLVPMIFFILFTYLPMGRMRRTTDPATSAACGQFLFVSRRCYDAFGGHAAFKSTMHDGVKMPRAARASGYRTDLFDGTDACHVRMYTGAAATWRGFAKNAFEGLGSLALLSALTVIHVVGHVLPWIAAPILLFSGGRPVALALAVLAIACHLGQRAVLAVRFRQPLLTALVHPLGVLAMVLVQWDSYRIHRMGRRSWRGRTAPAGG